MRKASKWLALMLSIIMVASVGLVGCGGSEGEDNDAAAEKSEALQLLEEGLAEEGMTIEDFSFEFLSGDTETARKSSEFLKSVWMDSLGVDVSIPGVPFAERLNRSRTQQFDVVLSGWGPDYNDPLTWFFLFETESAYNDGKWSNARYDELVDLARTETDQEKRLEYFMEAEKILIQDEHYIGPLYYRNLAYLLQPYVQNFNEKAFGSQWEFKWVSLTDEEAQKRGGQELHMMLTAEPPSLDPQITTDAQSFIVINSVQEGLVRVGPEGIQPGIAKDWTISEDGTTYTFNLREDAVWNNGSPITAQDFIDGWARAIDAHNASQYYSMLTDYVKGAKDYYDYTNYEVLVDMYETNREKYEEANKKEDGTVPTPAEVVYGEEIQPEPVSLDTVGLNAVDENTLEVTLQGSYPWFLEITAFATLMPFEKDFYEANKDTYATEKDSMLYNGPWVIEEWTHDSKVILTKNDKYWDKDNVKLDKITFDIVKDQNTSLDLYEAGDVDRTGLSRENVPMYKDDPNFHTFGEMTHFYFVFNTTKKPFNNVKVRKAISMSVNRQDYVDVTLNNGSEAAYGLVPEGFDAYAGATKTFREAIRDKYGKLFEDMTN